MLLEYREGWTVFEMRKRRTPSFTPAGLSASRCSCHWNRWLHVPQPWARAPNPSLVLHAQHCSHPPLATQGDRPCPQASPRTQGQALLSHCLTDPGLSGVAVLPLHQLPWRFAAIPMANATTHQNANHQIHTRHRQHPPSQQSPPWRAAALAPALAPPHRAALLAPAARRGEQGPSVPSALSPARTCPAAGTGFHLQHQLTEPRHCTQHRGLHSPAGNGQVPPHRCCRTPPYRHTGPV